MICEHCKEETGIGASHAYDNDSGEWLCHSLPPTERQPWIAVRLLQDEVKRLNLQNSELAEDLERARTYSKLDSRGCPLCTYVEGVFKSYCQLHYELHEEQERADLAERLNGEMKRRCVQVIAAKIHEISASLEASMPGIDSPSILSQLTESIMAMDFTEKRKSVVIAIGDDGKAC